MATYKTQIQWGGPHNEWHADTDLTIEIINRKDVIPATGVPTAGTNVSWSGPNGSANITFFEDVNSFAGSVQFPGEGPVAYRGQIK